MKVKFKLHSPEFLRYLGHDNSFVRSVPAHLYDNKEHYGELAGNDIVCYDNGVRFQFDGSACQYIKLKEDI